MCVTLNFVIGVKKEVPEIRNQVVKAVEHSREEMKNDFKGRNDNVLNCNPYHSRRADI